MMDYGADYGDDMDMPTDTYDANDQSKMGCEVDRGPSD